MRTLLSLAFLLPAAPFAMDMTTTQATVSVHMQASITPAIIEAIKAQNAAHANIDPATIKKLDDQWRSEVIAASKPFINQVLSNAVSQELQKIQTASNGKYVEIFVVDNMGLNVGQTGITTDYWQGDEPKFTKVFPTPGLYSENPSFDESAQALVAEVDGTILDGDTPIGTYTVKIRAE